MEAERIPEQDATLATDQRLAMVEAQLVSYARDLRTIYQAERARREQLERAYRATLAALSRALDMRDTETEEHSERVIRYTMAIAGELGMNEQELEALQWGAMLHDVGKIGIPDAILRKPGPLSPDEWGIMRKHPTLGYTILHEVEFLQGALPIVLHHHEKWNGKGYPHGLSGPQIPLQARIFAVADAFDAITSWRPYKRPEPHQVALQRIMQDSGSHFDPQVVEAFVSVYPEVTLSESCRKTRPPASAPNPHSLPPDAQPGKDR